MSNYAVRRRRHRERVEAATSWADRIAAATDYVRSGLRGVDDTRASRLVGPLIEALLDVGDQLAHERRAIRGKHGT
jgi:hypothetical protein